MSSPFDLTNLGELKAWLGIQGAQDDDLLSRLISQVSRTILTSLNRPSVVPTTYTEVMDGDGGASVMLRYWPVNAIAACSVNGATIPAASAIDTSFSASKGYVLETADMLPPGRPQRLSLRHGVFAPGVQNVAISYFAGYQVSGEEAIVPETEPYTIEALAPFGSFVMDNGVAYAGGAALSSTPANPQKGEYVVANGVYSFAAEDAGSQIMLTYGYIPFDLALAAKEWVAERYAYHAHIGQSSKSLGGQETVSFVVKDVPVFVAALLDPYRCVVTR